MKKSGISFAAVLFLTFSVGLETCWAQEDLCPRLATDSQRWEAVKKTAGAGHLVVLLRHAAKGGMVERDCPEPEQALAVEGFEQAGALRGYWQELGWDFSPVLSSPYCRTMQTAETAVPDAEPIPTRGLVHCAINELIELHKAPSSNLLMVTHSNCVGQVLGVEIPHADPAYDAVAAFIDSSRPDQPLGCALIADWPSMPAH